MQYMLDLALPLLSSTGASEVYEGLSGWLLRLSNKPLQDEHKQLFLLSEFAKRNPVSQHKVDEHLARVRWSEQ